MKFKLLSLQCYRKSLIKTYQLVLYKEMKKTTDFKSLGIHCWEINQVTSEYQMEVLDKTC